MTNFKPVDSKLKEEGQRFSYGTCTWRYSKN